MGHIAARWTVGLGHLRGLFQPWLLIIWFCLKIKEEISRETRFEIITLPLPRSSYCEKYMSDLFASNLHIMFSLRVRGSDQFLRKTGDRSSSWGGDHGGRGSLLKDCREKQKTNEGEWQQETGSTGHHKDHRMDMHLGQWKEKIPTDHYGICHLLRDW